MNETKRRWAHLRALDNAKKQAVYQSAVFFFEIRLSVSQRALEHGLTIDEAFRVGEEFARREFKERNATLNALCEDMGIPFASFSPDGDASPVVADKLQLSQGPRLVTP